VQQIIRAYEEYDVVHPQRGGNTANGKAGTPTDNPGKNAKKKFSKDEISKGDREAVNNRQRAARLAWRPLESFLRRVKSELGLDEARLTVCLVSDAEIARMNEKFRKKKGPTTCFPSPRWHGEDRFACGAARAR